MREMPTPEPNFMYRSLDEFFETFLPKSARPQFAHGDFKRIAAKLAQRALDALDAPPANSDHDA